MVSKKLGIFKKWAWTLTPYQIPELIRNKISRRKYRTDVFHSEVAWATKIGVYKVKKKLAFDKCCQGSDKAIYRTKNIFTLHVFDKRCEFEIKNFWNLFIVRWQPNKHIGEYLKKKLYKQLISTWKDAWHHVIRKCSHKPPQSTTTHPVNG